MKNQYSKLFKMPKPVKIAGRISSITNAFINGIIPSIKPNDEEIKSALDVLGMGANITCAYCGDAYTEWDHFRPLVKDQRPTGYISEINNLIPSCGKCNQSKGNREWEEWITSSAPRSPKTRAVPNLEKLIENIKKYVNWSKPVYVDFDSIIDKEIWARHWRNHKQLCKDIKEYQILSDEIKEILNKKISRQG